MQCYSVAPDAAILHFVLDAAQLGQTREERFVQTRPLATELCKLDESGDPSSSYIYVRERASRGSPPEKCTKYFGVPGVNDRNVPVRFPNAGSILETYVLVKHGDPIIPVEAKFLSTHLLQHGLGQTLAQVLASHAECRKL